MVVRLFNVYYPRRILILLASDLFLVCASLLFGILLNYGHDSYLVLTYKHGLEKVVVITGLVLLLSHYFDLYEPERLQTNRETYFRLLAALGGLSIILAVAGYLFPGVMLGKRSLIAGLLIMVASLIVWRSTYSWLLQLSVLRERVYVLGTGKLAEQLVHGIRDRCDLGLDIVGWSDTLGTSDLTFDLVRGPSGRMRNRTVDRVIVAPSDRRGTIPVQALLELKLKGIKVQDATEVLEKTSGKIGVDGLYPSGLIFCDGFNARLSLHRAVSALASSVLLTLSFPLLPLVALLIKAFSPGPVLYRQERVGKNGEIFTCFKFRTMQKDAEADTGPTWARDDDPRITRIGRLLRLTRMDELPQLWNVLRGDMAFVGPRPERPEFVEWLNREIPYYHLRHTVPPGITGWAQVRYQYGNSVEDAKEKLQYDLYYIKHRSLPLDLLIIFKTIKTILLAKGSRPRQEAGDQMVTATTAPSVRH